MENTSLMRYIRKEPFNKVNEDSPFSKITYYGPKRELKDFFDDKEEFFSILFILIICKIKIDNILAHRISGYKDRCIITSDFDLFAIYLEYPSPVRFKLICYLYRAFGILTESVNPGKDGRWRCTQTLRDPAVRGVIFYNSPYRVFDSVIAKAPPFGWEAEGEAPLTTMAVESLGLFCKLTTGTFRVSDDGAVAFRS